MKSIRVDIAGVGTCTCSLFQELKCYKDCDDEAFAGLMHHKIGDWGRRKVIARTDLRDGGLDV